MPPELFLLVFTRDGFARCCLTIEGIVNLAHSLWAGVRKLLAEPVKRTQNVLAFRLVFKLERVDRPSQILDRLFLVKGQIRHLLVKGHQRDVSRPPELLELLEG